MLNSFLYTSEILFAAGGLMDWIWFEHGHTKLSSWIELDWVSEFVDWVELDLAKWTHVQLCDAANLRMEHYIADQLIQLHSCV